MSHFKDNMGRFRTESLFRETLRAGVREAGYEPVFTLAQEDHPDGAVSMRRLFVEAGDITEYRFAMEVFGSWAHWLKLRECEWLKPYLEAWRAELEVKLKFEAVERLRAVAADPGNKQAVSAAKWLAEGRYKETASSKRGRPTKQEVASALQDEVRTSKDTMDDAERLGVMRGSKPN